MALGVKHGHVDFRFYDMGLLMGIVSELSVWCGCESEFGIQIGWVRLGTLLSLDLDSFSK